MDFEIKTRRLVLRSFREKDAPRVETLAGDWDVARMTSLIPHPYPPGSALTWFTTHSADRAAGTHYRFAVTLNDTCIGAAGLHRVAASDWGLTGDILEIGYWIGKPYWGQGYATEAAGALVAWGFTSRALPVLAAGHFFDNPASRRILEKIGFTAAGQRRMASLARGGDVDGLLLLLTRAAWAQHRATG